MELIKADKAVTQNIYFTLVSSFWHNFLSACCSLRFRTQKFVNRSRLEKLCSCTGGKSRRCLCDQGFWCPWLPTGRAWQTASWVSLWKACHHFSPCWVRCDRQSHHQSPVLVSGRRILCGECEGEHAIQPLLPHQECHGSSLLLEVLHTMRKFASFVEQEGRHLCRHKHGMVSVTAWGVGAAPCNRAHGGGVWPAAPWVQIYFSTCLPTAPVPQGVIWRHMTEAFLWSSLGTKPWGHFFHR